MEIELRLVDKLSGDIKKTQKSVDSFANSFKKSFTELNAKIQVLRVAFAALGKVVQSIEFAAKAKQQAEAFDNLARSVQASSDVLIESLKKASGQTLSNLEVMESASKAIILGLDPNKLAKLMEISRAAARAFGQDVSFMFDSITLGIGRQSRMILDNLGIIVSSEKAYKKYAESLNINVNSLTDVQKRQAFLNETLAAGEDILRRVAIEGQTQTEVIAKAKAAWEDFSEEVGVFLLNTGVAKLVFTEVNDALTVMNSLLGNIKAPELVVKKEALAKLDRLIQLNKDNAAFGRATAESEARLNEMLKDRVVLQDEIITREKLTFSFAKQKGLEQAQLTFDAIDAEIKALEEFYEKKIELGETDLAGIIEQIERELEAREFSKDAQEQLELSLAEFRQRQREEEIQGVHDSAVQMKKTVDANAKAIASSLERGISDPLSDIIQGTKSTKEAFAAMGKAMIKVIADQIAQTIVAATIGQSILQVSTIFAKKQAKVLEEAWKPAAIFAAVATAGGAVAAGTAAIAASFGFVTQLAKSAAGQVPGGSESSDTQSATPFADGGIVTRPTLALIGEAGPEAVIPLSQGRDQGGFGSNTITINIIEPQMDSDIGIEKTAEMLGEQFEIATREAGGI